MDAVIHFGMPKTGSSSIQQTLFHLQAENAADFTFLTIGNDYGLNRLVRLLQNGKSVARVDGLQPGDAEQERDKALDSLAQQMRQAQGKALIFSSEVVPFMKDEEIADLREQFIAAKFPPKAVGYIRPPKGYIESIFQQRVKESWGHMSLDRLFPRFKRDLEKFDTIFGRENVAFCLFDSKHLLNGCVVQDFSQRIGITVPPEQVRRANDALSQPAIQLLYAYRKFGATYGGNPYTMGNAFLVRKMRNLSGAKLRFHSCLIAPLLEEFKDDVRWMEDRMGVSLAEDLTKDDATAIRSERQLLTFGPRALQWLSRNLADHPLASSVLDGDPEIVARGMHALYNRLLRGRPNVFRSSASANDSPADAVAPGNDRVVKNQDIVLPAIYRTTIKEETASMLMENLFDRIKRHVRTNPGGQLIIENLGAFRPAQGKNDAGNDKAPLFVFKPTSLE